MLGKAIAVKTSAVNSFKLTYLNNIKVLLTILVILHHTVITYGGAGGWYYIQKTSILGALIPMTLFVSVNQSFFMGFFFLLAAYLTPGSYEKKRCKAIFNGSVEKAGYPVSFLFIYIITSFKLPCLLFR